ncbi:hypothetical protein ABW21_db0209116 [Orbilia brochopaga]|nr:hypothetical protein ABW21_db0209116 [Drechslerella brochopaga]
MPPGFHKQKTYGTVRRGGTARQSAFRGSVRAWDAQRNRPSGLLRQQPTDAAVNKENAADTHSSCQPVAKPIEYDSDIDKDDSFVLDSPPDSPLVDRILPVHVSQSIQAVPVKTCFQPERAPAKQDVENITSMPAPQPRRALAPKSDNSLNVAVNRRPSPTKCTSTPKKPAPKSKKSKGKRKATKKTKKPSSETEDKKDQKKTPVQVTLVGIDRPEPHATPRQTSDDSQIEQLPAAIVRRSPSPSSTPVQGNRIRHTTGHLSQNTPVAEADTPRSPIICSAPLEESIAQPVPSPREIEADREVEVAHEEPAAEHDLVITLDADREDDVDDAEDVSPKRRAAGIRKEQLGKRKPKGEPLRFSLSSDFQPLTAGTPTSSTRASTSQSATPTPSSTRASSIAGSDYICQQHGITPLAPESQVFNLLRCCEEPRLMTFEEYLTSISPDFSRIKKIGESSFAEVFVHRKDDGTTVVLKLVRLDDEMNARDVMQELKITRSLSPIDGFINYLGCQVLAGGIPHELSTAWATWEQAHNAEDYDPTRGTFYGCEYHAVIALEDGGCSLEDCNWKTWDVPLEIFRQTLAALANGERERRFEHRDLHGGNLLVRDLLREQGMEAPVEDANCARNVEVGGFEGVMVTVIDYTLSRADLPGDGVEFLDIPGDTFGASGLYQFEIYRMMREELRALGPAAIKQKQKQDDDDDEKLNWETHCPRTNVVWLHFISKILIRQDDGRRKGGKLHIVKPRESKKNTFELACRETILAIHDALDWSADERPLRPDFKSACDVERWCEGMGLFNVLDEERERRRVVRDGEGAAGVKQPRRGGRRK